MANPKISVLDVQTQELTVREMTQEEFDSYSSLLDPVEEQSQ